MKRGHKILICDVLACNEDDIKDIKENSGMTNKSYTFVVRGQKYLIRIPGAGANELVNRKNEFVTYSTIRGMFGDEVVYINAYNGIKISKFIEGGHVCDSNNWNEIKRCLDYLHKFHDTKLSVPHTFDLEKEINKYDKLMGNVSKYDDYDDVYDRVMSCLKVIKKLNRPQQLVHIDPNPDNFFITDDKVYLLDWEYAAMQDPLLDIAMFAIYCNYNEEQIERLLYTYEGHLDKSHLLIVYAYCAIAGLLWSNWCEYKEHLGQDFGQYALNQYEYAKNYSKKLLKSVYFQKNV